MNEPRPRCPDCVYLSSRMDTLEKTQARYWADVQELSTYVTGLEARIEKRVLAKIGQEEPLPNGLTVTAPQHAAVVVPRPPNDDHCSECGDRFERNMVTVGDGRGGKRHVPGAFFTCK